MGEHPEFRNPPIKEAIIDIQISAPEFDVSKLYAKDQLVELGFSECKPLFSNEFILKSDGNGFVQDGDPKKALIGYRFDCEEDGFVAQFRKSGFTFSKVGPYCGWEAFRNRTKQLWSVYAGLIRDFKFRRIAVRYINILELPFEDSGKVEVSNYLVNDPKTPIGLPNDFSGFFSKVDVNIAELKSVAVVTQAPQERKGDVLPVVLDIDVFRLGAEQFTENEAWEFIEKLRVVKNNAFVGSITDQMKERFN